jgi:hypothetical protein
MSPPALHTLWVEGRLGWLERACLASAVATGHDVTLFTYHGVEGAPSGVTVRDAADVMPFARMRRHKGGSWSLGSNLFRYEMQRQGVGVWIDADVYFLRALPALSAPVLFGWQKDGLVNGAVFWAAPESGLIEALDAYLAQEHIVPYWMSWRKRLPYLLRKRLGLRPLPLEAHKWGVAGPRAITWAARERGLLGHAVPQATFYPYGPKKARDAFDPSVDIMARATPDTMAIHLWNEALGDLKRAPPPPGSFMARICAEQGVEPAAG